MEYSSAIVSSNPCIETLDIFFLLSIWTDELLPAPQIATFLPQSKFGNEKSERDLTQYHILNKNIYLDQYLYLT